MSLAIKNLFEKVSDSVKEGDLEAIQKERLYLLIGRQLEEKANEITEDDVLSNIVNEAYEILLKKPEKPEKPEKSETEDVVESIENEEHEIVQQEDSHKEKPKKNKKYSLMKVKRDKETGMVSINGHSFLFADPAFEAILQKYLINSEDIEQIRQKAAEVGMNMLLTIFDIEKDNDEQLVYKTAFQLFRTLGMGIFFKSHDDSQNLFHLKKSYMAEETFNIFGKQKEPACHFAAGYLAAVYAFIKKIDKDEIKNKIAVIEKNCCAMEDEYCFFEITNL
ncbi:MAG: 4-vinyl reductase [Spirochaetia bacterium]|nr:4-vinyl reductase [Spirochaetia bacterium]